MLGADIITGTATGRARDAKSTPRVEAKQPPDYRLSVGATARPPGRGWILVDYSWDEDTGLARLSFRRRWNTSERVVVEIEQPAHRLHAGWRDKPEINRDAVLARYFDTIRSQAKLAAVGAYAR
jgi:hypothetical protein